jgi:hypothetical protein
MSQSTQDELLAALDKFGVDEYNRSNHPLVAMLQGRRPRCISECSCRMCKDWWSLADEILNYIKTKEPHE